MVISNTRKLREAFEKHMQDVAEENMFSSIGSSAARSEGDGEVFNLAKLEAAFDLVRDMGPPPTRVRFSKLVPALVEAKPISSPLSDDMRAMCDDIGPQKVPGAYSLKTEFGDVLFVNPANISKAFGEV